MAEKISLPCPYGGTAEYERHETYAAFECDQCGGLAGYPKDARAAADSHFAYARELEARAMGKRLEEILARNPLPEGVTLRTGIHQTRAIRPYLDRVEIHGLSLDQVEAVLKALRS